MGGTVGGDPRGQGIPLPLGWQMVYSTREEEIQNAIVFSSKIVDWDLGEEGYILDCEENRITITGDPAGAFYAVQTLFQLLPPEIYREKGDKKAPDWTIPAVQIIDKPRFKWRGMHLDVGRHMFPVEFIKRYIDYLAMHKLNKFHWHFL